MELFFDVLLPLFETAVDFWLELIEDSSKLTNPQSENDPGYFLRLFLLGFFGLTFLVVVGGVIAILV